MARVRTIAVLLTLSASSAVAQPVPPASAPPPPAAAPPPVTVAPVAPAPATVVAPPEEAPPVQVIAPPPIAVPKKDMTWHECTSRVFGDATVPAVPGVILDCSDYDADLDSLGGSAGTVSIGVVRARLATTPAD